MKTIDLTAAPKYLGESPIGLHRVELPDGRWQLFYSKDEAERFIRNSRAGFQEILDAVNYALETGETF